MVMTADSNLSSDDQNRGRITANLKRLGKYEISRRLGVGGMGTVYLATDSELKRTVALKVLPRDRAENPTLVRRFRSEGQAAALLKHPNIVSVYEAGQADGYLFLALEYVEGLDVLAWMHRNGTLTVKRSIEIVRQVAQALQHAYERNIVHRDIKPSNLMISRDGTVKLTDMGLARSIDDTLDSTITRDGTTVGTVDYMAPEQAANSKSADIRSDIYSLGCTWFHMLTGTAPYVQGSVTNKLSAHASAPIPDPRTFNPKIPEAVVAVIHRMMAKTKEGRYQSPRELLKDLDSDGLIHGGRHANLLAMFDEDDFIPAKDEFPGSDELQVSSSAVFELDDLSSGSATPAGGAPRVAPGQRKPVSPTRVDQPASGSHSLKGRPMLERMGGRRKPGQRQTQVPWSFLFLIGVALILGFVAWAFLG